LRHPRCQSPAGMVATILVSLVVLILPMEHSES
jgi:hypothetical protein